MNKELLEVLKTLHLAVLRHGLTEGDGEAWFTAFTELKSAMQQADAVIRKAARVES